MNAANAGRAGGPHEALRLAAAAIAMHAAGTVASSLRFPFAGGEFHAMFAYTGGHLPAAFLAYRVRVGAVCLVAVLLVAAGYRLRWQLLALAASMTAAGYWWDVYTWHRGQSEVFHRTAGMLLLAIPVIAFAACGAAHALRRPVLARITARSRVSAERVG
jgi:hypothetical protein